MQRQICICAALYEPTDHTPIEQIYHDPLAIGRQLQEAPVGAAAGGVIDPELARRIYLELPVHGIVRHTRRAATIEAGLLLITNLGPCARQSGHAPSLVGADVFARIAQIVMQL